MMRLKEKEAAEKQEQLKTIKAKQPAPHPTNPINILACIFNQAMASNQIIFNSNTYWGSIKCILL